MSTSLDNLIAIGLVILAAGYLARRAWRVFTSRATRGCGACASCPSSSEAGSEPQLISVDALLKPPAKKTA